MKVKTARVPRQRDGGRPAAGKAGDRPIRGANALDRYSLALQLVQVGQPVTAVAAVMVGRGWPAWILAVLALVGGSLVVLHRERIAERHAVRRPVVQDGESGPFRPQSSRNTLTPQADDAAEAAVAERKAAEEHAFHLSIRLRRESTRPYTRRTPQAPWPIHQCSEAARSLRIHRRTADELDE